MRTITMSGLRSGLGRVVGSITRRTGKYVVTRRGRPVLTLISIDEFDGMSETIEILSDDRLRKRLRASRREILFGKTIAFKR